VDPPLDLKSAADGLGSGSCQPSGEPLRRQAVVDTSPRIVAALQFSRHSGFSSEPFFVTVKMSAFLSLIIGFPLIATQLWAFVAPGLYRHEKAAFRPFLIATPFSVTYVVTEHNPANIRLQPAAAGVIMCRDGRSRTSAGPDDLGVVGSETGSQRGSRGDDALACRNVALGHDSGGASGRAVP